jgi:hypothetical protein
LSCLDDTQRFFYFLLLSIKTALSEINLKNKDDKFINSRQAEAAGGILSALENAGIPSSLTADFGKVSLLNKV